MKATPMILAVMIIISNLILLWEINDLNSKNKYLEKEYEKAIDRMSDIQQQLTQNTSQLNQYQDALSELTKTDPDLAYKFSRIMELNFEK